MAKAGKSEGMCPVDPDTGRVLETPEIRALGLAALRSAVATERASGELKIPREDDRFMLPFLRARKYNIEKSLLVLKNFSKFWYNPSHADVINGLCAAKVHPFYDLDMARMLPGHTDRKGNTLSLLYAGGLDYSKFTAKQQMGAALYMLAYLFDNEELQLQGVTYVETFEGFSLRAAMGINKYMSSGEQKELMAMFTDTFPLRVRDIWVVHQPWYFTMFWTLVRPFMSKKLTKRIHLIGSKIEELHAAVDPIHLPAEFGGTLVEAKDKFMTDIEAQEKLTGKMGGFAVPFSVDDPMGVHGVATGSGASATGSGDADSLKAAAGGAGVGGGSGATSGL